MSADGAALAVNEVEAFAAHAGRPPHMVIIVENMAVPADRRVWQEATALARAGWQVSVICPKSAEHQAGRESLEGVEIHRHPLPLEADGLAGYLAEYSAALFFETFSLLRIGLANIDVVQICNPPDFLFVPAAIAKWFGGARIIFDHHDLTPELLVEKTGKDKGPLLAFARWAERQTFRLATQVISTNEAFREIALARGGVAPEKTSVVYSAPDLSRFERVPPDTALKQGKTHLLLWIGMIGTQDGVDLLLDAAAHLKNDQEEDFHLVIAGDGPQRLAMIEYASELGLAEFVSFPGFVSGADFARLFSTADIGIGADPKNPFNDQLAMNKVMEYMAYELPIVMFDLTECRRIAGDAALIAEDNDPTALARQIKKLMDDQSLRQQMGRTGRARLEAAYSWDHQRDIYLKACTAALEEGKCQTP